MSSFDKVQLMEVASDYQGQRIDNFLIARLKGVPKSRIYRILRKGEVRVNKKRVKAEYKLQAGDLLRIPPIRVSEPNKLPKLDKLQRVQSLEQNILFENKQFILLNKPSGMAVHGGSGLSFGVIEAMRALRPREKYLELVHRLDRDTSGCLLISKRRSYLNHFQNQLRQKKMQKQYLALVTGQWPKRKQIIDAPLLKRQIGTGERVVTVDESGKSSQTRFACVEQYKAFSLVNAWPKTGRTHQIRVHAQFAGCPLAGDDRYNDKDNQVQRIKGIPLNTFLLHAQKLSFTVPDSEETLTFEAPVPELMQKVIKKLREDIS